MHIHIRIMQSWPQKHGALCEMESKWKLGVNGF